ncbi:MAG: VOC family protein [Planctomycetota bacterium]|nr:MAG: VOC family protein [Planctomycetota bacterium]
MRIEHFAINVPAPLEAARWYVEHLRMRVVRRVMEPPWAHFLQDAAGLTTIEIYGNRDVSMPDYHAMDPRVFHIAFAVEDVAAERERLLAAGAVSAGEIVRTPNGDTMVFLRDPWGVPLQLVYRRQPL